MTGAKGKSSREITRLWVFYIRKIVYCTRHQHSICSSFFFIPQPSSLNVIAAQLQSFHRANLLVLICSCLSSPSLSLSSFLSVRLLFCHFALSASMRSGYEGEVLEESCVLVWRGEAAGGEVGQVGAGQSWLWVLRAGHHARLCHLTVSKPAGHSCWF